VELDPSTEVVTLIGSKEGLAHISFCYLQDGDTALIPDPRLSLSMVLEQHWPVRKNYLLPLKEENGFLPDLRNIPTDVSKNAKLMFL